jgi:hypothetical protein
MEILKLALTVLEHHFGAVVAIALGVYLIVAYSRGELKNLFAFLKEMLSDAGGHASTKSAGFFAGVATLCWSFAKVTLAVCRRIDTGADPNVIFVAELAVIATLVGAGYLFGKYLAGKFPGAPATPPEDTPDDPKKPEVAS